MYLTDISGYTDYTLHDSFILDCGATTHVCNNCQHFCTITPAIDQHLYTGDQTVNIVGFGAVDITVQLPQSCTKTVTLGDTAYVLLFQTNTVLYKQFEKAGDY